MDTTSILGICAIIISLVALMASSTLAYQQVRQLRNQNHIPAFIEVFSEFRRHEMHTNFKVIAELSGEERDRALSELSTEKQKAILDAAYYFQTFLGLILIGALNEDQIMPLIRARIVRIWRMIGPIIHKERTLRASQTENFLVTLEYFALREAEADSAGKVAQELLGAKRAEHLRALRDRDERAHAPHNEGDEQPSSERG